MTGQILERDFYARETRRVARDLLGAKLLRIENGRQVGGWIIETEAYLGAHDLASHSRHGRTRRNDSMWGPPGHAYVYFTYGMHWMLNLVTESDGEPGAVLLRALYPSDSISVIRARRGDKPFAQLTDGPAKLCQGLNINRKLDGVDVCVESSAIIVLRSLAVPEASVTIGPRVGLNTTPEPWHSKPWRYRVRPAEFEELIGREKSK